MASLPERIAEVLASFHADPRALDALDPLYAPHVIFEDPIQRLEGRANFRLMNERLIARASYIRFEDVEVVGAEPLFMARWKMVFRPRIGPELTIPGASEFRSEGGLVVYHRDYWDLAGALMSGFPFVEPIYRRLVALVG